MDFISSRFPSSCAAPFASLFFIFPRFSSSCATHLVPGLSSSSLQLGIRPAPAPDEGGRLCREVGQDASIATLSKVKIFTVNAR
ncbi:hypothetical protein TGPRC2_245435 [Toxoplasma gondii TgCatPRC2]|uniref:Uncharacterized protein n=12 Tax=Toxoplasma gondii TaxID=5811 RepID=A0A125YYE4_TOXGV|nr:hypothetical protein TGME49_245435 [Toxoplasma gondii ME49]EPR63740.1 hypothetical protein TGGT1_245435 [Toxoplasma gondii GT1]ESS34054.1 hypothetical protein TGVEG_245435 [Toxoplasma gondii VEG]KFG33836.1 hypothetical protein TGFOU_245435 [Toxoplasma gondii FOU]KFG47171.1 hypothetical protein TGDOM2_245435 [Toxoplasma gondii GAB2-2007-GAL-DOM2]KFG47610.1 hypothetical protein TGP89_245435 [Toxoplasma gondii p89]KFG64681.1 hypothetical protein TGRUB_245435 [Toxoplasma gondii RUB]KFH04138.1|eukprot:XP_018634881.1 hypothetical protein TGME49_245435 [Toxoplasma gondii ME49]